MRKRNFAQQGIVFTLLYTICSVYAHANSQPLREIRALVKSFTEAELSDSSSGRTNVKVGKMDSRLKLPLCTGGMQAFLPTGAKYGSHTTVGVRCSHPKTWTIYVSVTIEKFQEILVAARTLRRGETLSPGDMKLVEVEISNLRHGVYTDSNKVIGTTAQRRLEENQPLNPNYLCYVCKGELITINAASSSLNVSMQGIALTDGGLGDTIRVRNRDSKRELDAVVYGVNEVRVVY